MSDEILFSEEFQREPTPYCNTWRETKPVWWSDRMNGWVVTTYEGCRHVLTDSKSFRQAAEHHRGLSQFFRAPHLTAMDPPEHTHVRGAFKDGFRPSTIKSSLAALLGDVVTDVVNAIPVGRFEAIRHFSAPLARKTVASMLGAWEIATEETMGRLDQGLKFQGQIRVRAVDPEVELEAMEAGGLFVESLEAQLLQRKANPQGDLLSGIVQMGEAAGLNWVTIRGIAALVMIGGYDTTRHGLGSTLYYLGSNPEQQALLRAQPELIGRALDEAIRLQPPTNLRARMATQRTQLHGTVIEPDEQVYVLLYSANRDRGHFQDPDLYELRRPAKEDHISFGSGIHYCLGAPVARLEAAMGLTTLLERFPRLRLDPDHPIRMTGMLKRYPEEVWLLTN